ncbi:GNAT family N-acetyltransferase [Rhizobium sp. CC-YZS058]|uniref:GNAT family N-acetyltransferase n=1 Tax=Rhizobium sp. CC-YZS058 TaxID=3042153 RepID=UPI002B056818|nr:GNAT family N-acetyltransferase [Rhizobium sp. CC-YZS058]MEA3536812.1 GNAT family N-acetyltransferase [Rhizobium sp. CC-YZS058]
MPPDPTCRAYRFRPVTRADLPRLALWLAQPHIQAWWGPVDDEIDGIAAAIDSVETRPMIVELDGEPIAYAQSYDPHLQAGHPYQDQPKGTLGIDLSIGPADRLGQGHGSAIARALAAKLFAEGTTRIVIDPHPDNSRAIRAYEKAGFRLLDRRTTIYGPAHFMALDDETQRLDEE